MGVGGRGGFGADFGVEHLEEAAVSVRLQKMVDHLAGLFLFRAEVTDEVEGLHLDCLVFAF